MIALEKMFEKQEELNTITMGNKWANMNLSWRLAITQETAEFIDSFSWKWWKKTDIDLDNAKIEIVDIWHFALSLMIEAKIVPTEMMESKFMALSESSPIDIEKDTKKLIEYAISLENTAINSDYTIEIAESVMLLAGKIGFSYGEMIKIYFGKAVLNNFRQLNGYTDGTYVKNWEGSEDNEVMLRHISTMEYTEDFDEALFLTLTDEYTTIA